MVDDDPVFLDMLNESLSGNSALIVYTYNSAEQCIRNLHLNPEIIVLDHDFSKAGPDAMTGLQAIGQITEVAESKIIILTGQEDGEMVFDFIRKGASDYIIKDEDLFENIEIALSEMIQDMEGER